MSIRLGYQVHCDRSDCNRHAEFVCEPDELWEQMRHAGWTVDRRSRDTREKTRGPPPNEDGHHAAFGTRKGTQQKGSR